jgi:hypothetical protein
MKSESENTQHRWALMDDIPESYAAFEDAHGLGPGFEEKGGCGIECDAAVVGLSDFPPRAKNDAAVDCD